MAEAADLHPTAGRRRRDKGPPSAPALPRLGGVSDTEGEHSDDSAGEKEAKRQRSEPTTPVSTSSRLPYEYDALMGITKVGTKEAEGFDEEVDSTEYHDASEELTRKEETESTNPQQKSMEFQGGYGSSSLKECIELLNATANSAPAPLDGSVRNPPIRCSTRSTGRGREAAWEEHGAGGGGAAWSGFQLPSCILEDPRTARSREDWTARNA